MEKTKKLGLEPAFPSEMDMALNNGKYASFGISKRLYIATMAMNLPNEHINPTLTDDDMQEDAEGFYIRNENGTFRVPTNLYGNKRYSVKRESTYEKRLARFLYDFADEMLKLDEE